MWGYCVSMQKGTYKNASFRKLLSYVIKETRNKKRCKIIMYQNKTLKRRVVTLERL